MLDTGVRNGGINQPLLRERVSKRVCDRRVLKLLRGWLQAGVMEQGTCSETVSGTPQGGVISPLLSNIYLHFLDSVWQRQCADVGKLVRYADGFVVLCTSREGVEEAERRVRIIFEKLKLTLHPEKARQADLTDGKEGFDFLGCHLHMRDVGETVGGEADSPLLPPTVALETKHEVGADEGEGADRLTAQRGKDVDVLIQGLNPVLRGWGNYFRTGNAARKFLSLDKYVVRRLNRFRWRRHGRHAKLGQRIRWFREDYEAHGLHRPRGTIRYPRPCMLHRESPPVSRVRGIRMHGMKGGGGTRTA